MKGLWSFVLFVAFGTGFAVLLWNGFGEFHFSGNQFRMNTIYKEGYPALYVRDFRVKQGEKVRLSDKVVAKDVNGENLNDVIQFVDRKRKKTGREFDTSVPGCYGVEVSVQSRVTGKKAEKRMTILVDGRVLDGIT